MRQSVSSILLVTGMLVCAGRLAAQQVFDGRLLNRVQAFSGVTGAEFCLKTATPEERRGIPGTLAPPDLVLAGSFDVDGESSLKFRAALVKRASGQSFLYVDENHDGRFTTNERLAFHLSGAGKWYAASLELNIPLEHGPYATIPVTVDLVSSGPPVPAGGCRAALEAESAFYVQGRSRVGERWVVVRLQFDPSSGGVDLPHAQEWIDSRGDGRIDYLSNQRSPEKGKPPVFQVGSYYLTVSAVNVRTRTFTMKAVPASEYTHIDWSKGAVLPDFAWTDFNGLQHRFSDLKGKYRLIDFWATWCGACVADLPALRASYSKFHDRGFEILGIDGDAKLDDARKMVVTQRMVWPEAQYSGRQVQTGFGITMWPTLILVDRAGRVITTNYDDLDGAALDKTLASLLSAPAGK